MSPIALQFAMADEAAPLLDTLGLAPAPTPAVAEGLPFRHYAGEFRGKRLVATVAGKDPRLGVDNIGLEPAALAAFVAVRAHVPSVVVSAGTCGSFAALGAAVGDVYLSGGPFRFHDHRIPLGAFAEYGRGDFPGRDVATLAAGLGLKTGIVSSGSSLDYTERDLEVFRANGATLKEMEAAAIAWVCSWTRTPFFAVKSVTNLLDETPDSAAAFVENFRIAVASLTRELPRVIAAL